MLQQLSGMDAGFLYMETASSFGHVASLSVYRRPDDPSFRPYEAFRSQLSSRLHLIEPFRRKLVTVPFGLARPYWTIDPDFDIDFHVRHLGLPAPGTREQLAEQVARIMGRQMDRARPLWEAYVLEGLEGDEFAILTKIHHATIDGASGVELLTIMLDAEPTPAPDPATADPAAAVDLLPAADAIPTQADMMLRGVVGLARDPFKLTRLTLRALGEAAQMTRRADVASALRAAARRVPKLEQQDQRDEPPRLPRTSAPPTPFNKMITPHRRLALRTVPLDDIKTIKNHLGTTVNDVVMAACAGALRRYLEGHGQLSARPLVAMIPVSIRGDDEHDKWTNRVSGMVADLPTDLADPVERVHAVHRTMVAAKQQFDLVPADLIADFTQFAAPALATRAIRLATATRIADRMRPPINLVISNVPGPRRPLYMAGATMTHFYPVSTLADGMGLNITVQSYLDSLDFGLMACRELVPDVGDLADLCVDEIRILLEGSAPSAATPAPKPAAAAKRTTPKKAASTARAKAAPARRR